MKPKAQNLYRLFKLMVGHLTDRSSIPAEDDMLTKEINDDTEALRLAKGNMYC